MKFNKEKIMAKVEAYIMGTLLFVLLVLMILLDSCSTPPKRETQEAVFQPSAICPLTEIVLQNNFQWDDRLDRPNLNVASKRCIELYKSSPCLTVFTKIGYQRYWAVCGAKNSQTSISEDR